MSNHKSVKPIRIISHLTYLIIGPIIILCAVNSYGQTQPLSRNDKAQIDKSLEAVERAEANQNHMEASRHLNDIAFLYWSHNDYPKAIEYYERSLAHNQGLSNENGIAMLENNLGMLYSDIGDYEKSLNYFEKTLTARRAFKNEEGIISALKNMSVVLNNLGRYDESQILLQEALTNARKTNDPDQISSCYMMLSETYEKAGDVPNTKRYYQLYQTFYNMKQEKDLQRLKQIADEESILKQIAEIKSKKKEEELQKLNSQLALASEELDRFDQQKIELTDALSKTQLQVQYLETEQENERLRNEEEMRQARALRNLLLLGAGSLGLISFFIYRNYRQEKKSKQLLSEKNDQISAQNQKLEELNKIIAKHNERMQSELNVGREIQMSMIPSDFPEIKGIDLFAALEPALEVGGDLYDFFRLDDDHFIFGVGDVSDKGVPAALIMAVTKTLVKTHANYSTLPGTILTEVNKALSRDNDTGMFVTYFLCVLNTKTGMLSFCNAGHNPPLYIDQNGQLDKLEALHGPVLGAIENYKYKQGQKQMTNGDQIIIFTDGITEAMNHERALYSNERLDLIFSSNGMYDSKSSVDKIMSDVALFRGDADQSDDMTILSLRYSDS